MKFVVCGNVVANTLALFSLAADLSETKMREVSGA